MVGSTSCQLPLPGPAEPWSHCLGCWELLASQQPLLQGSVLGSLAQPQAICCSDSLFFCKHPSGFFFFSLQFKTIVIRPVETDTACLL